MTEVPTILRTYRDGCFAVRENAWGQYLDRADDPDANAVITDDQLASFELKADLHKIPAELWQRWIQLCFHFCEGEFARSDLEVSVRLLRKDDDRSVWRMLVPHQGVSGGSVHAPDFNNSIDIETGEVVPVYPPDGWTPAGSSHSHNTMHMDRFSSVDDRYELSDPGLHIVISHIDIAKRTYRHTASITAGGRRFYIPSEHVVDATPVDATFNRNVLSNIETDNLSRFSLFEREARGSWQPPRRCHGQRLGTCSGSVGYRDEPDLFFNDAGDRPLSPKIKKLISQLQDECETLIESRDRIAINRVYDAIDSLNYYLGMHC